MKKFGKFVLGTISVATLAAGAYFIYKNFIKKDLSDDFDDFEDDFDDFDEFDSEEEASEFGETREYVSIQIDHEGTNKDDTEDAIEDETTDEESESADTFSDDVDFQDEA